MNQKYLSGSFSNADGSGGTVFFEATPENISAFLMEHRSADTSMVGTADGKPFLTALTGFIDVCPDQAYLCEKLLPVYARVQMGEVPVPELKTVPKEEALAEECPMPDWNYMRWGGCSDEKYRAILNRALLRMSSCGCDYDLEVQVGSYCDNGNLAIQLADWTDGEPEPRSYRSWMARGIRSTHRSLSRSSRRSLPPWGDPASNYCSAKWAPSP